MGPKVRAPWRRHPTPAAYLPLDPSSTKVTYPKKGGVRVEAFIGDMRVTIRVQANGVVGIWWTEYDGSYRRLTREEVRSWDIRIQATTLLIERARMEHARQVQTKGLGPSESRE